MANTRQGLPSSPHLVSGPQGHCLHSLLQEPNKLWCLGHMTTTSIALTLTADYGGRSRSIHQFIRRPSYLTSTCRSMNVAKGKRSFSVRGMHIKLKFVIGKKNKNLQNSQPDSELIKMPTNRDLNTTKPAQSGSLVGRTSYEKHSAETNRK